MFFSQVSALALACLITSTVSQYIDPNSVPLATRDFWCQSQITQCPLICLQYPENSAATYSNTCDSESLTYSCVCSNGLSPNASEYSQTLPYFTCTEYNNECVANCGSDNTCASSCRQDHPCGAQNPKRYNITSTSASAAATSGAAVSTASDGAVYTGFGGAAATSAAASEASGSTGSSSAASRILINAGQMYGLGVVAAGVFAGVTLLL